MGVRWSHDPDRDYELTTDNVKKILAIHMRFRCVLVIISHFLFACCGIKQSSLIEQVATTVVFSVVVVFFKPLNNPFYNLLRS